MISIFSVSNYFAKGLANKITNNKYDSVEDQIDVLTYGIMFYVGIAVKGLLLVSISLLLGVVESVIVLALTFSSFRSIGGGIHLKNFATCIIASLFLFMGSAFVAQHTYQHWSQTNILSLLIFSIISAVYIIIRYVPRDTPNNPITLPFEINKFKRWSSFYLTTWTMLMTIFLLLNIKIIVIASCFGLLLELLSISTLGQKMYTFVD